LLRKEDPRWLAGIRAANRFENATTAVGDDWNTARLRFDRRNAEIFFRGEEKAARSAQQGPDSFAARPTDERDV
jgi:hypothetical protein